MTRQLIGVDPDGQEVLVTLFDDGSGEVAYRDPETRRWGLPIDLTPNT